ncbi:MAG: aminomethyltransferase family protein [Candidatus Poribacteria bacterium]|nr:aminomethyltransferase family protein [Candidatus Poribacteria bacterium]MDE0505937.1 aminomethyltransferase family protein [Candidatus Poribacteria bacterium]
MKRTPLYSAHTALGATFTTSLSDWVTVAHFADPIEEHHAVRNGVGFIDLSHRGRLWLTGDDRATFLHRINSNDVEGLKVGEGNCATMLTNRGKIIADMKVCVFEDGIGITTNAETTEILFNELDKYIIADDVNLEDCTDETGIIAIHGPQSSHLVQASLGIDVTGLKEYYSMFHEVEGHSIACIRSDETGETGYELYVEAEEMGWLWDILLDKGKEFDARPFGLTALDSLRIEAGIPRYGAELTESVLPLEAELEHAIDFEKGCYIGQEIVARMKYRGHPNRLLRGFEIECDTPPAQNDLIFANGKEIGWITSAVNSPSLDATIALGYVRMAYTDAGSKVKIITGDDPVNATVAVLPFYKAGV